MLTEWQALVTLALWLGTLMPRWLSYGEQSYGGQSGFTLRRWRSDLVDCVDGGEQEWGASLDVAETEAITSPIVHLLL